MIFPAARVVTQSKTVGSGFVVAAPPLANDTYILTNHHVVSDAIQQVDRWDPVDKSSKKVERQLPVSVELFRYDERGRHIQTVTTSAEVVAYTVYGDEWSFEGDLALLRLRTSLEGTLAASIISEPDFFDDVRLLDEVVMVGCPDGNVIPLPTTGHIASMTEERAGVGLLLSQLFGKEGSSGSAVYRYSHARGVYEVVAIHSMVDFRGSLTDIGKGSFLRLAVPAPVIHSFLERHGFDHLVKPKAEEEDEQEANKTSDEANATNATDAASEGDKGAVAGNGTGDDEEDDEGDVNSTNSSKA